MDFFFSSVSEIVLMLLLDTVNARFNAEMIALLTDKNRTCLCLWVYAHFNAINLTLHYICLGLNMINVHDRILFVISLNLLKFDTHDQKKKTQ